MLLFRGELLLVDVDKLSPVETDAVGTVTLRRGNFFNKLDICPDLDPTVIPCHGGKSSVSDQIFRHDLIMFFLIFIAFQYLRIGVNNNAITRLYLPGNTFQPHNSGYFHGTCHNSGVGCFPPHIGGKAEDILGVDLYGVSRRQIPCYNDNFFVNIRYFLTGFPR